MSDVPDLSSDEEQYEEDEWQEMETANTAVPCLFCSSTLQSIEEAVSHCETLHEFMLGELKVKFNMDCYSYIKLINYITIHKPDPKIIMSSDIALWDNERYLKPVENHEWLMFDFESLAEKPSSPKSYHANVENGLVTLSQAHFIELQKTIQTLTEQLKESKTHLQLAKEDMSKMKSSMKSLMDSGPFGKSDESSLMIDCVSKVPLERDEGYFNSYAHFGIHHCMLSDKIRTESYRDAILQNKESFKEKVVLDLGCGTGILSMFAATAGAKKVYALDQSDVIYHAMDIIRENKLENIIQTVKGRLEDTNLDEKVDIIVSEWMGYFLLFEGMLDSVIYARDRCLNPGGLLLPNKCNISLVANGDVDTHKKFIEFWSDVYGYKMNCMKSEVVREASVDIVPFEHILSEACVVKEVDINTCTINVMNFESDFELVVIKDGYLTSLVGYFDTFFELPEPVSFTTGPHKSPTHWRQTVFFFKDCKQVNKGDIVRGKIVCKRQKTDVRSLSVEIHLYGKVYKYILN